MKQIVGYLKSYWQEVDIRIFSVTMVFMALFVWTNYHFHLNHQISQLDDAEQYPAWYLIFAAAFGLPYLLYFIHGEIRTFPTGFILLFFIAPALFSWKMVYDIDFTFPVAPEQNLFWNQVLYWPIKLAVMAALLFVIWKVSRDRQPFYGFSGKHLDVRPYLLMLLIMVPLIAAASTQPDFLSMYPKMKHVAFTSQLKNGIWYKILYELSYGSDFITIEMFFRGFLVLAFVKWFGKKAILPMACFYCTIHFGKPLGECVSSFFGGLILGVVTYHTRSIFGGLMVHLGIAWLMELGGSIGNSFASP